MRLREVHLSAEAIEDLQQGRSFYDAQENGVGDYFLESVLGDLAALRLHAGVHRRVYGHFRLLCSRFPSRSITTSRRWAFGWLPSSICAVVPRGFAVASARDGLASFARGADPKSTDA